MDKNDYKLLKEYLENTSDKLGRHSSLLWYKNHDDVMAVARILAEELYLREVKEAISFFEKPWKWESDMQEIIDTYGDEFGDNKVKVS